MMPQFELLRPNTLGDALTAVSSGGTPYCGGTELLAVMKLGLASPTALVDLKLVPELDGIEAGESEIIVRARTTHSQAANSALVKTHASVLAQAAAQLGNSRVRATGTLAGNICFAEPRSDVVTSLMALGAHVDLVRPRDIRRSMSIDSFVQGAFTTAREDDELVEAVRIPHHGPHGVYLRFQPNEYPTVAVAIVRTAAGTGVRVVVGAVGDRPEIFALDDIKDVDGAAIAETVDVTEDLNGAEDYKRHLTSVFVDRAVERFRGTVGHA